MDPLTTTAISVGAPILGKLFGGLLGGNRRPTIVADSTSAKELMDSPTLEGPYGDLAVGRGITQGDTPWLGMQDRFAGQQQEDLSELWRRAQGQDLLSKQAGLEQLAALQASTMGQAASARGRYNPALQAETARQSTLLPAQMSAGMHANEAAEKLAALKSYNQGADVMRQQGQAAHQAWLARQEMERKRQLQQEQERQAMMDTQYKEHMDDLSKRVSTEAFRTGAKAKGIDVGKDPYQDDKPVFTFGGGDQ